jgi:hypothetical protein
MAIGDSLGDRGSGRLSHQQGLTGEAGLVDLQPGAAEDAAVGGDGVPGLELDDIAGHQLLPLRVHRFPIATKAHPYGAGSDESPQGAVRSDPLAATDQGIDCQHRSDENRVHDRPRDRRGSRGSRQGGG